MTTIDLAPLFSGEQHETKISLSMPLDGITDDIVSGTAEVNGTCTDRVGFVQLHLRIRLNATAICSRCARQFPYRASMERVCRLIAGETGSEDEEEDYYILDGTVLDAQALSRELIILGSPSALTCSDNCKGLCPNCGADLNEGCCKCGSAHHDPRLAKLTELAKRLEKEQ